MAPLIALKPLPLLTYHCTVTGAAPVAAAVKVAVAPTVTIWLVGWVVIAGPTKVSTTLLPPVPPV